MPDLSFDVAWEQGVGPDPLDTATQCSLCILVGGVPITQVRDDVAKTTRDVIRVAAYPLALWLAAGWWRLRWEGRRSGHDWELTHRLPSVGAGFVWPNAVFESDGEGIHIAVEVREKAPWEPIVFLARVRQWVRGDEFDAAVLSFIETVVARLVETGHIDTPLHALYATLQKERRDARLAAKRRLEALLGFDSEDAPEDLLRVYEDGARRFGEGAVAELAAIWGRDAPPDWGAITATLQHGARIEMQDFSLSKRAAEHAVDALTQAPPWQRGEAAAQAVRGAIGKLRGPLSNADLQRWLGADVRAGASAAGTAIGERMDADAPELTICFRSRHPTGRRFELCRLLADHLVAANPTDRLLPATRAKTARQSLQRAFAAELLLPWPDLEERIGADPTTDAIEDAASEFEVSPLVVRTRLVAKGLLPEYALGFDG